jgi:tetratricopeptide (TPR) repeat protein
MSTEPMREHAKDLYELALNSQRSKNYVHAINVLCVLVEIADPFYTPFALGALSQCYNSLGKRELEAEVFRRVTKLPPEQQLLLNPGWLSLSYQKSGDLKAAKRIAGEILGLAPNDSATIASLAELSLLDGEPEAA